MPDRREWTVMTTAVVAVIVFACWVLGSLALVMFRRRMGHARWQRLFHPRLRASRFGIELIGRWRGTLARLLRSRAASWWGPLLGAGLGVVAGHVGSGPVAAAALGAYGAAGFVFVRRRTQRRARARAHRIATDALAALAADLRAGAAQDQAMLSADSELRRATGLLPFTSDGALVVTRRIAWARVVSQASGAPLAELLDRLDAHLRSIDRTHALAETQAAGARASGALLAVMPAAGVGLGAAIGVDPVRVLLHTTAGGLALCTAVVLQLGGLAWTARLARVEAIT